LIFCSTILCLSLSHNRWQWSFQSPALHLMKSEGRHTDMKPIEHRRFNLKFIGNKHWKSLLTTIVSQIICILSSIPGVKYSKERRLSQHLS
jgi:hypothetical protein